MKLPIKPRPPGARKKGRLQDAPNSKKTSMKHGFVKSFDGTRIFYCIEGKGKPLIFCYGLVCSSLHWTYQIDYFKNSYQTVWFDYRGHQNSEIPKDPESLTIENTARDLGVVLDTLKLDDVILLGHSMGVNIVLEFYRQQPDRVAAMVLANGTAQRPLETFFGTNLMQPGFQILRSIYEKAPDLVKSLWKSQKGNPLAKLVVTLGGFNPHLTPQADIALYVDQVADMDPSILLQLIRHYETYDATPWLHTVKAPTLIIAGEHDRLIPLEQQELMHQLIPNSEIEVVRHGSHCPQMDFPDQLNARIEHFIKSI
jgi:non-heme chloroperoxidase